MRKAKLRYICEGNCTNLKKINASKCTKLRGILYQKGITVKAVSGAKKKAYSGSGGVIWWWNSTAYKNIEQEIQDAINE